MTWLQAKDNYGQWVSTERQRARVLAKAKKDGLAPAKIAKAKQNHDIAVAKVAEYQRLANPRAHPGDRAALAYLVLHHKNSRCSVYNSPTGGYASAGLEQAAKGGKSYVAATGQWVYISVDLLRGLVALLDHTSRPIIITCIVNGSHRSGSLHYQGRAADVVPELDGGEIAAFTAHGAHWFDEDSQHDHLYVGSGP
jgi:hypothetical protein